MLDAQPPKCRNLVLDAGPLLSLSPLRGVAEKYITTPQVLAELRDPRAREHFEKLGLMSGVKVEVRSPTPASLSHVIQWSKKTGDYSVLSHADLCVLALTHTLHEEVKKQKEEEENRNVEGGEVQSTFSEQPEASTSAEGGEGTKSVPSVDDVTKDLDSIRSEDEPRAARESSQSPEAISTQDEETSEQKDNEPLNVQLTPIKGEDNHQTHPPFSDSASDDEESDRPRTPLYEDPSDEEDGEGEWITPANVALHKSKALDLLPDEGLGSKKKQDEITDVGCMTADFAMQNVLLQMGLNLVGLEGRRIEKVKTWVLRCHACFKICKDNSKKFCPSCGNPTLLRASVTLSSPNASKNAPVMQIHLKPNFQYKLRGTKYSIPAPKPGSAKGGAGTGLILREDQTEYMRAKKLADGKRQREEQRLTKGILAKGFDGGVNAGTSSWMDPDWMPEIVSAGASGKGRTMRNSRMDGDLPQIGFGRKNPNEKRRKK